MEQLDRDLKDLDDRNKMLSTAFKRGNSALSLKSRYSSIEKIDKKN